MQPLPSTTFETNLNNADFQIVQLKRGIDQGTKQKQKPSKLLYHISR